MIPLPLIELCERQNWLRLSAGCAFTDHSSLVARGVLEFPDPGPGLRAPRALERSAAPHNRFDRRGAGGPCLGVVPGRGVLPVGVRCHCILAPRLVVRPRRTLPPRDIVAPGKLPD